MTLFGLGMFSYAAVKSLGWALHNQPVTAIPMLATLLLAGAALAVLISRHGAARGGG